MKISRRGFRLGVHCAVLGAVYLGLAASAMAWNEPLWVRRLGSESSDYASGVATDTRGNVYLTGYTWGSLGGTNRGGQDAWAAKYDAAGHLLWKRHLGTETEDVANGVATDAAGNVYLTGYTLGSLGGVQRGGYDAWVVKYDTAGDVLWKRQIGTEDADFANGVATDVAGNVYLTGSTWGSLGGAQRGKGDAWVAKYDAAGHVLWKRQLEVETYAEATGVATDATGNVYLTGNTQLAGHRGPHGGRIGDFNAWAAKYDAAGHLLWKRQLGTEVWDEASGVAADAAGNVYLSGSTYGSLGGANRGWCDAWAAKYDAAGHLLWKQQLGTKDDDYASGVTTDAAGNVYLTGLTKGSFGGAQRGDGDAWAAKYTADGDVLWIRQLGTEGIDVASGVATDTRGNVYLTGWTSGSLGGAQRGDGDAWVAKYSTQP